ncbi:MAG: HlyD family efflux transporter periplasmic adaptor subunit [Phycisphaerae bacterium]
MTVTVQQQRTSRNRWRRLRRGLLAGTPVMVWCVAIVAALYLHQRSSVSGTVLGFADDQPVTLAHLEPGVVREVHVRLYDTVARGHVLVTMDASAERIQLRVVEADVERLAAEVLAEKARLEASNSWSTADVEDLARRFAVDREAAHVDYLSQLVINARDRILLRGTTVEYGIERDLYEHGDANFREFNDIQTEVDALKEVLANNATVLARTKEAFEEADRRWSRFIDDKNAGGAYEPVLTPLRLAIEVRKRGLEEIVRRIDAHVLRAPVAGQVTDLMAHAGDRVEAGSPLVLISPTSTSRVLAYLPEQMILSPRVGRPVTVRCLASAGGRREFPGAIVGLSATVSEAPVRFRTIPSLAVWGRGMLVELADEVRLIPGEVVRIALPGS